MELLPKKIEEKLPLLYATEETKIEEKILQIRYHSIYTNWEWYVVEYNKDTKIAFGYVIGQEKEWGYFSIEEFQEINKEYLQIIRDEEFVAIKYKELLC